MYIYDIQPMDTNPSLSPSEFQVREDGAWQSYVDNCLLKTCQVTEAAIHGLDGAKWASSKNLNVCQFVRSKN